MRQKEALARVVSGSGAAPHVLCMTATPIPRTMALMAFGHMLYSVLNEMPPDRL